MIDHWVLVYEGLDRDQERLREALCTLGNGYFATRGAAEEVHADEVHYPGTYIAGGFNRLESQVAGRTIINEDLVNFPNWLCLTFRPDDGEWLDLLRMEILSYRQELHLRDGLLIRRFRVRDKQGRETSVVSRRLVHMGNPHLAAIECSITPENWSGQMRILSTIDGSVTNAGVARYQQLSNKHLRIVQMGGVEREGIYLHVQTSQSRFEVAEAARTQIFCDEQRLTAVVHKVEEADSIGQEFAVKVSGNETITVEKIVALYTSRDRGITEAAQDARLAAAKCGRFEELLKTHHQAWKKLWRKFDVSLDVSPEADHDSYPIQLILRLHIFHLLQTASPNTIGLDVSIPARGLHGEAYRGHIFWDEVYIFPFYNLRLPEITRSLLLYRYHRLDMARLYAKEVGLKGALFPWQSGSNGREETQLVHLNPMSDRWDPDHSRLQRHVNAACAYNIWQYYQTTGDRGFLELYGAEMVLEIARFWASLATYNQQTERYEIVGVMGPDEYHEKYPNVVEGGLKNNAYSNVMAVWCLEHALEVLELISEESRQELVELLDLKDRELKRWREIARKMTVIFHEDGVISQFEGYEQLKEFDWGSYRNKYGQIGRADRILKAEGDSSDNYRLSKQADLCMLFYLLGLEELQSIFERLGYPLDDKAIRRNVEYYLQRTSHGSTLSYVVFASVLNRIDGTKAWEYFRTALRSDIEDIQRGTTPEGIHTAAMVGTINMVLHNYAGVDITSAGVSVSPHLPDAISRVRFRAAYRGDWIDLDITKSELRVVVDKSALRVVPVLVDGASHLIEPGDVREFSLP